MADEPAGAVTELLARVADHDRQAADALLEVVYGELRKLARAWMAREKPGQTLQPTALVHEAYLRLIADPSARFANRHHFFAAAAEAMRRILIERARRVSRQKRGGGQEAVPIDETDIVAMTDDVDEMLEVDRALSRLQDKDPVMGEVVKLRYFAGMTVEETAEALGLSTRSVNRLWMSAKAWLKRETSGPRGGRHA
jgi:RNA polymerase sigma factor (TIGR02999 family)